MDFRIHKLLLPPADLPDAIVGAHPIVGHPIQHVPHLGPHIVGNRGPVLVIEINRIHQFAIDVELQLIRGGIANAHRARAAVPVQMVEGFLRQGVAAINAVHELQRSTTRALDRAPLQPPHELLGLVHEAEPHQPI